MAVVLGALGGCPGPRAVTDPVGPTSPAADAGVAAVGDGGAAPGPEDPIEVAPRPITTAECGELVDRLIAIGLTEQRARNPRAPQATAEQQVAIRARLLAQAEPSCATMTRTSWACAVAAADRAAMVACEPDAPSP